MDSEEDAKRRIVVGNERAKLLANALDRASTACVTVGILAPVAAFLYGIGSAPASSIAVAIGAAFAWFGSATVLHMIARSVLGSIR